MTPIVTYFAAVLALRTVRRGQHKGNALILGALTEIMRDPGARAIAERIAEATEQEEAGGWHR